MALTAEAIQEAENNEALIDLLSAELQRLLPEEVQENRDLYHEKITSLPRGLRAMAGMHFFDVSMAMDDLAWHFGNQNDERDLRETLSGLRELELTEIASCFEKMWEYMKPYMTALQTGDYSGKDFPDWLESIGAQQVADPMNDIVWDYCKKAGALGLLESWPPYARKYPERCLATETQA